MAQSNTGKLFRVDPDTGIAEEVDLGGELLPGPDGLELRGNTLYVVGGGVVTVVRLGARLASGVVLGDITDPGEPNNPLLDVPTTATVAAGRLWVVNARFNTRADAHHGILDHPTAASPRRGLRSRGLTKTEFPRLLHPCAYPAGYRPFTLRRSKSDALALLDERSSGLLLADGSGSY